MMDGFDNFIPGVIHSNERYTAIVPFLKDTDADVISLNEVDATLLQMLCSADWVQDHYIITDASKSAASAVSKDRAEQTFTKHGVVMLVRKGLGLVSVHGLVSFVEGRTLRPSVVLRLALYKGMLAVVGSHFDAYNTRFRIRRQQLRDVYRAIRLVRNPDKHLHGDDPADRVLSAQQMLVMGDFNFHQEAESMAIEGPYADVWSHCHAGEPEEEGYTWDSQHNGLIRAMWLGMDARRMRLDRVVMNDCGVASGLGHMLVQPSDITVVGKQRLPNGLCMSDHYGLLTKLRVACPW